MKYSEEQLKEMTKPASDSEEARMDNATRMVKDALYSNGYFNDDKYEIFAQGSYANNTNVRNNSDVDINVCYIGAFYYDLPDGTTKETYGFGHSSPYSYSEFKNDVESILVKKFGRDQVIRKNKCIHVKGNAYRSEIDVVPTWEYRRYVSPYNHNHYTGVKLFSDNGSSIVNYPKQHLENGKGRNVATRDRYKKLVRIVKRININMENDGYYVNEHISSFLLESMVYLLPDRIYQAYSSPFLWNDILKNAIFFWYEALEEDGGAWKNWTEVSELLRLMYGHKWSLEDVKEMTVKMWNYLGYAE